MRPDGDDGGYLAAIPATEVTPDGIDYYLKAGAGSTYDPRLAESGRVAHAVAVYLPEVASPAPTPAPAPQPATPVRPEGGGRLPATGGPTMLLLAAATLAVGLATRRLASRA